jgi:hypothetical protein
MPPLRKGMVMSLRMPHKDKCPQSYSSGTCRIPGCTGNQVTISEDGEAVTFTVIHHKSGKHQQSFGGGPIMPTPPANSPTANLSIALITYVLPWYYAQVEDDDGLPTTKPMLPDMWTGQQDDRPARYKEMTEGNYTNLWEAVCLGPKCFKPFVPAGTSDRDILLFLQWLLAPFCAGTFPSADCRRLFVTSLVLHHYAIMMGVQGQAALSSELKRLAARQIGNTPEMWTSAYDMLLKVTEAQVVESIMANLKKACMDEVAKADMLKSRHGKRRTALEIEASKRPKPGPEEGRADEAGPSTSSSQPKSTLVRMWDAYWG